MILVHVKLFSLTNKFNKIFFFIRFNDIGRVLNWFENTFEYIYENHSSYDLTPISESSHYITPEKVVLSSLFKI